MRHRSCTLVLKRKEFKLILMPTYFVALINFICFIELDTDE